jgi:HK97 gp10 family phage protein
MAGSIRWYGPQVEAEVRAKLARKVEAACIEVEDRAKALVSRPGTAPRAKATGGSSGRRLRRGRVYGAMRSAPGEPPLKQTGHLRRSIAHEVDRATLVGRVGTNLRYGRFLETGTRKLAPRPWLRRALAESRGKIDRIFSTP